MSSLRRAYRRAAARRSEKIIKTVKEKMMDRSEYREHRRHRHESKD